MIYILLLVLVIVGIAVLNIGVAQEIGFLQGYSVTAIGIALLCMFFFALAHESNHEFLQKFEANRQIISMIKTKEIANFQLTVFGNKIREDNIELARLQKQHLRTDILSDALAPDEVADIKPIEY
jgi:hypothetical protein